MSNGNEYIVLTGIGCIGVLALIGLVTVGTWAFKLMLAWAV